MNCKPGDLAVITQCSPVPECVGRIVECVAYEGYSLINGEVYQDVWEVRWGGKDAQALTGRRGWGCPDAWMRPIRDPGDDAVDETLVGNPVQEPVTA